MGLVAALEAGVVDVEGVGVLHDELAAAQQAGAGTRLVAVLRLDLVDRERQVLVRRVEVLHHEGEHLLVRGTEQVVGALAVLEPEDAVAVLGPAAGGLVGLAGQQRGERQLLGADRVHLVADDLLDPAQHPQAERQPGVDAGGGAADVAGPDEQPVARHLGVRGVLSQGPHEQARHPKRSWGAGYAGARARREPVPPPRQPSGGVAASSWRDREPPGPDSGVAVKPDRRRLHRPHAVVLAGRRPGRRRARRPTLRPAELEARCRRRDPAPRGQDRRRRRRPDRGQGRLGQPAREVGRRLRRRPSQQQTARAGSGSLRSTPDGDADRAAAAASRSTSWSSPTTAPRSRRQPLPRRRGTRVRVFDAVDGAEQASRWFDGSVSVLDLDDAADGARRLGARTAPSGGTPAADDPAGSPTGVGYAGRHPRRPARHVHQGPLPGRVHASSTHAARQATGCGSRARSGSRPSRPAAHRMATIHILSDGIGPQRRAGCARSAAGCWPTTRARLVRCAGGSPTERCCSTPTAREKSATVRCVVADCERASDLRPVPDLRAGDGRSRAAEAASEHDRREAWPSAGSPTRS